MKHLMLSGNYHCELVNLKDRVLEIDSISEGWKRSDRVVLIILGLNATSYDSLDFPV